MNFKSHYRINNDYFCDILVHEKLCSNWKIVAALVAGSGVCKVTRSSWSVVPAAWPVASVSTASAAHGMCSCEYF